MITQLPHWPSVSMASYENLAQQIQEHINSLTPGILEIDDTECDRLCWCFDFASSSFEVTFNSHTAIIAVSEWRYTHNDWDTEFWQTQKITSLQQFIEIIGESIIKWASV